VSRHGRGIRVSHPGLVATVAKTRRGLALRHCGDVGSSVAQQGDEWSSGEQWPEVGVRVVSLLSVHASRPWSGQGRRGVDSGVRGGVFGYG
jgi:hypothetical protein